MTDLRAMSEEELLEAIEHGLDEYEGYPASSLGFTIRCCVELLRRQPGDAVRRREAVNLLDYVKELVESIR